MIKTFRVDGLFEYGRWPKGSYDVSVPGALPLAMLIMAVGQQNGYEKPNFKTSTSVLKITKYRNDGDGRTIRSNAT